ncbi:hypothetical protein RRSWK_04538 [Rhodopirellula sp. SWK7]|nr:hypothetical protein RRSWK_04538 [Rhodopirellula sp. SWK7]
MNLATFCGGEGSETRQSSKVRYLPNDSAILRTPEIDSERHAGGIRGGRIIYRQPTAIRDPRV